MRTRIALTIAATCALSFAPTTTADNHETADEEQPKMSVGTFSGMPARGIGPALMSGRIGDIVVNPDNHSEWYVAVASGNIWKTTNKGTTFEPVFDNYGSYSIGCLALDPSNRNVVWAGTGENNSQRSVAFGDGVYKTVDGGKSWTNMGLEESEHVGMIVVHPDDSDTVFVASQGPLWNAGGDRGLYKTTDGGETWERILHISEDTGINEVHLDPRDPDTMYASAYQRRRAVWTLINGGPESGIYKSTDGGESWREVRTGLPTVDMGRIGLDISPVDPDVVYAIVEAANDNSGFYRSSDRGETWERRSDYISTSPQYYNEIVCDPHDVDRVYSLNTFFDVTEDGGKNFRGVPIRNKHVDDHALWIDPEDPDHLVLGSDGGIYTTYDRGANWGFHENLPVTQFYRVAVDEAEPFYNIYGGTQDNATQGGPSRTTDRAGITNADWFVVVGGDGFEPAIDPTDPDIVYAQWQYGGLVRHDRRSGEITDIKPRQEPGETPYVWNWNSPLLISPHSHTRLYYGGNYLAKSEDRGNSWERISPKVHRDLDRNDLEIMGEIQKPDAVAKHMSTSIYGNSTALSESPIEEGLIYLGSDDGLIHVTDDGGDNWRTIKSEDIHGMPGRVYVSWLFASQHDSDVVYAAFENHKRGDFAPYAYRSDDRGRTWTSIAGDLPERHFVYSIQEDHVNEDLLFAGTEFGAFFTVDGGERWIKLSGVPTISARDLDIQRRENDLAIGTFGRGFYILDDYSPLREVSEEMLTETEAHIFPVRTADLYIENSRLGGHDGRGWQGASFYTAPNPPFGATFTYYIRDKFETIEEMRFDAEMKEVWAYPTLDEFRAEEREREPRTIFVIEDEDGNVVRRFAGPRTSGIQRITWDLRYPAPDPVSLSTNEYLPWQFIPKGPLVAPGTYSVTMLKESREGIEELAGPVEFEVEPLDLATFDAPRPKAVLAFQEKVADLHRAVQGSLRVTRETQNRIDHLRQAIMDTPDADLSMLRDLDRIENELKDLLLELRGDPVKAGRGWPTDESISSRVSTILTNQWLVTSEPTGTERDGYEFAADAFEDALEELRSLIEDELEPMEDELEGMGAPWTPGRLPEWERE